MKTNRISKILVFLVIATLLIATLAMAACDDKPQAKELTELQIPTLKSNQMAVIIKNGDNDYTAYTVTLGKGGTSATTAEGVLQYLHDEMEMPLDWQDSSFGKYIHGIGKIAEDTASGKYVMVYTTVVADQSTEAGATTYEAGNLKIVLAGVGISSMTVEAGAVIYFELVTYTFDF